LKINKKIFYADCLAAALAKLNKREIITGDQKFKVLVSGVKIS
jgi:predicted nucleic acid-binding protein